MPPISSGGTALLQMLNVLEGSDLKQRGFGSVATIHLLAETMRRAFADRARYLGDPEFNLTLAATVERPCPSPTPSRCAGRSRRTRWGAVAHHVRVAAESSETTHFSVMDDERNAVALTSHARVRLRLAHRGAWRQGSC